MNKIKEQGKIDSLIEYKIKKLSESKGKYKFKMGKSYFIIWITIWVIWGIFAIIKGGMAYGMIHAFDASNINMILNTLSIGAIGSTVIISIAVNKHVGNQLSILNIDRQIEFLNNQLSDEKNKSKELEKLNSKKVNEDVNTGYAQSNIKTPIIDESSVVKNLFINNEFFKLNQKKEKLYYKAYKKGEEKLYKKLRKESYSEDEIQALVAYFESQYQQEQYQQEEQKGKARQKTRWTRQK